MTLRSPLARTLTGLEGLDQLISGGLYRGGIYMVSGEPGTGKTVLGNHIAFNHIVAGGRVLYVTLLAETHERLLHYIASFGFFDDKALGESILYINGYQTLEDDGFRGLIALLQREIRSYRASLVVIDGIVLNEQILDNELSFKHFVRELQPYLQVLNCTALMLTHMFSEPHVYAGRTMVDGLLELTVKYSGPRAAREIEIRKFRGTRIISGRHSFEITSAGITVYPRIEAYLPSEETIKIIHQQLEHGLLPRCEFGVPSLDTMLHGGIPAHSSTMLLGAPGAGKTLLGLHFLMGGVAQGDKGFYMGFYEEPYQLYMKAQGVGINLADHTESGNLMIQWEGSGELNIDYIAHTILEQVRQHKIKRLVVDGFDAFREGTMYPDRLGRFFSTLTTELRALGVTTLFLIELSDIWAPTISSPVKVISAIADNLIFMRYVELRSQLYRLISILKMRTSGYEPAIREFRITSQGIDVAASFDSAEAILTGVARLRSTTDVQEPGS